MPKIDKIRNRAYEIAEDKEKIQVGVAHLLAAILEDKEVQNFITGKTVNMSEIQNLINDQVDQSASRRGNLTTPPTWSEPVDEVLEEALGHIKQHKDKLNEKDALIILAVLLGKEHKPAPVKILENNKITLSSVASYLDSYGIKFWDERLLLDHDNSTSKHNYEPIIGKDDDTFLSKYTQCLNDLAYAGNLPPTVGRTDEIEQIIRILRQKRKNNPLLIGESGVGKTAIVEGLAQMASDGTLPSDLEGKKIFQIDLNSIISGTRYRGMLEERIEGVLNELSLMEDSLLFIDEMHMLMEIGDFSDVIKPALARGELNCIGTTTFDDYRKSIEKDKALSRRFAPVTVDEPTLEETHEILMGVREGYEDHHDCVITSDAVGAAIDLSIRYIMDRKLPDKAIEVMDAAGALMREMPMSEHVFGEEPNFPVMTPSIVARALAKKTGLPLDKITASDRDKILSLTVNLNSVVFGQKEAAEALSSAVRISKANLADEDKPIGNFLLRGPTGVGKTEMTKQLAEELGIPHVRLDMSECMERHSVSKLIGAPPGYVGYDEGGALTEKVNRKPHCVLLLDEIEKAHPDVFNILLQVMDNGELTDSSGKTVNFRNVILCMTSNVGEGGKSINAIGFGNKEPTNTKDGEFEETFRPEFRNRLDADIRFNALTEKVMPQILDKVINELEKRLEKRNAQISFTVEAKSFLVKHGFNADMGARPLKRVFKQHVIDPIATKMLEEDFEGKGGALIVSTKGDGLSIAFHSGTSNDNRMLPVVVEPQPKLPAFLTRRH
jgi:ATP-dependent Clp protease ATP-binding subunit ClpA